eukprot:TRINITY_DN70331_c0_g1_i2.p1 TRINITY_DN70331_c0_g1~~TRINITY_DN70331_c0_g1_i2.p1  ORF type:complete len:827 (-),score=159.17 TRINITY_DN70331_c0_g1_i2:377-2857(-)
MCRAAESSPRPSGKPSQAAASSRSRHSVGGERLRDWLAVSCLISCCCAAKPNRRTFVGLGKIGLISQSCGEPGTQERRDWLRIRKSIAAQMRLKAGRGAEPMEDWHALNSFHDLPAFDACPAGALALRLLALSATDAKKLTLLKHAFKAEYEALSKSDFFILAGHSGWGSVIFQLMNLLSSELCDCEDGSGVCIPCEWREGSHMGVNEKIEGELVHWTVERLQKEGDNINTLEACDWKRATERLAKIAKMYSVYGHMERDSLAAHLRSLSGALACKRKFPIMMQDNDGWLLSLLESWRPFWPMLSMVAEHIEGHVLDEWEMTAPAPQAGLYVGDVIVGPYAAQRTYIPGLKLCQVKRQLVTVGKKSRPARVHALVVGASVFEAPMESGKLFVEFPLLITDNNEKDQVAYRLNDRNWRRKYGDSPCEPAFGSAFVRLSCEWPGGEVVRAGSAQGGEVRPATPMLITCSIPPRYKDALHRVRIKVRSDDWSLPLHIRVCQETPKRHRLTVCPRVWFGADEPALGAATVQQFVEYHAALGVDHFFILDADGRTGEALQPIMQQRPGLVTYNPRIHGKIFPEVLNKTGDLRYPYWAAHPTCHDPIAFGYCFFQNRDSELILHLHFFDKFLTGARGMQWDLLEWLRSRSRYPTKYGRVLNFNAPEVAAVNIYRKDMSGEQEAEDDLPLVAQFTQVLKNLTGTGPLCGALRERKFAFNPIYKPYKVLLPRAHWNWLFWRQLQCYPSNRRIWVNHYNKLGGSKFRKAAKRGEHLDAAMKAAVESEKKRVVFAGFESESTVGQLHDRSLHWAIPWFQNVTKRLAAALSTVTAPT